MNFFPDPPISTSWVLCLQVCAATPSLGGGGNQSRGLLRVKQTHHQPSYALRQSPVVPILKNCGLGLKKTQRRGELKENSSLKKGTVVPSWHKLALPHFFTCRRGFLTAGKCCQLPMCSVKYAFAGGTSKTCYFFGEPKINIQNLNYFQVET